MPEALWLGLALLVMVVGIVGCVVPAIPGTPLIFASALLHRLLMGPAGAAWWVIGLMGALMLLSILAEYGASYFGARSMGATRWGMAGAVIGGIVGLFFGPIGILTGPFLGAFVFELVGAQREIRESLRAGVGATIGLVLGAGGKVACAVAMFLLFASTMLWRAFASG